jgi:RNA polymerase sigma-70 factor (ECF subfamily)
MTPMAERLAEIFEGCQRRYPTVQLSIGLFQSRVAGILASDTGTADNEAKLHYQDLFLATACAEGDRVAWEYFTDDYFPLLKSLAIKACGNASDGEDLAQEITAKLLQDKDRIAGYNGRGSLASWLRVAVSHAAIDRFRRVNRLTSLDSFEENQAEALCQRPGPSEETERLDSRWGPIISRIAEDRLHALPARDRLLLSLYYLQGVPLRDIGRQFGVHEATASRWLERLRNEIRKEVERELRKKHGLRPSEIYSLWQWVSPEPLAGTVAGSPSEADDPGYERSAPTNKKSAMSGNSGVINKEEVP